MLPHTKRGGWPFANPPNTQFTINTDSPQSKGLVFWLPFTDGPSGGAIDLVRYKTLTPYNSPVWIATTRGMAMSFNGSSTYLQAGFTDIISPPFTMMGWVYNVDASPNYNRIVGLGDIDASNNYHTLEIGVVGDIWKVGAGVNGGSHALTTSESSQDVWFHACGIWKTTSSRFAYPSSRM